MTQLDLPVLALLPHDTPDYAPRDEDSDDLRAAKGIAGVVVGLATLAALAWLAWSLVP